MKKLNFNKIRKCLHPEHEIHSNMIKRSLPSFNKSIDLKIMMDKGKQCGCEKERERKMNWKEKEKGSSERINEVINELIELNK